jgi:hypothetical protein
LSECSW